MAAMCRNPKVWIVLGIIAVGTLLFAPSVGAIVPLLLILACPLSMIAMAGGMAGMSRARRDTAEPSPADDELARLRAEVAELRASQPSR